MADEEKKKLQIKYDASIEAGVYANVVSVTNKKQEMVLDFGYIIPNIKPPTIKVVSRVNLSHETAENFLKILSNAVLDDKNTKKDNKDK